MSIAISLLKLICNQTTMSLPDKSLTMLHYKLDRPGEAKQIPKATLIR